VDGFETHETDLVCDLHAVSLPGACFDAIFCTGTLEHVADPSRVLGEMARLLVPGGLVHVEVPFMQGFHADPEDYWRWTLPGLRLFCRRAGFEEVRSGVHMGPSSALAWVAHAWVEAAAPNGFIGKAASGLARLAISPVKYMDRWMGTGEERHRVASGVFFVGRKPANQFGVRSAECGRGNSELPEAFPSVSPNSSLRTANPPSLSRAGS
jgi:SAM-dependent methyltransferase